MMSKLVDVVNYMITWAYMNIKGQGHPLALNQGHSDSTFSNFFFWETTRSIEAKFDVDPTWYGETKIYWYRPGHMTEMADMPIYNQNLKKKTSSLEAKGRWPWKLICSVGYFSTTMFVQMVILGWPWPILWQGQILSLMLLCGKKVKQWIFQKPLQSMISKFVDAVI